MSNNNIRFAAVEAANLLSIAFRSCVVCACHNSSNGNADISAVQGSADLKFVRQLWLPSIR